MVNNTAIKEMNELDKAMKMENISTSLVDLVNDTIATNLNEDKCLFKAKKGDKGLVDNLKFAIYDLKNLKKVQNYCLLI